MSTKPKQYFFQEETRPALHPAAWKWLQQHLMKSEGLLAELEIYAQEHSIPILKKESQLFLQSLVTLQKPKQILEIGTGIGYSAISCCQALKGQCQITTLEINEKRQYLSAENFRRSGYQSKIRLILGDAVSESTYLDQYYDMVFLDAAKGHYKILFEKILPYVNSGGLILTDNLFHGGRVWQEESKDVERRQRTAWHRLNEYADFLSREQKLCTTSFLPLGDGLAMTVKR